MPPSLARSSGAPSKIGTIRLVATWSDIHHSTHHASQQPMEIGLNLRLRKGFKARTYRIT